MLPELNTVTDQEKTAASLGIPDSETERLIEIAKEASFKAIIDPALSFAFILDESKTLEEYTFLTFRVGRFYESICNSMESPMVGLLAALADTSSDE